MKENMIKHTNDLHAVDTAYKLALAYMNIIQNLPEHFFVKDTDRESSIRRIKTYLVTKDKTIGQGRTGRVKSTIAAL